MNAFGHAPSKERDLRWQRVRDFMEKKGLAGLVVAGSLPIHGEPLDRYLSNWMPGAIVVFPLRSAPALLVPMAPQVLGLTPESPQEDFPWIMDIRPGARGSVIAGVLMEKGLEKSRIGVVGTGGLRVQWEGWIPFNTWNKVLDKMPECTFIDVTAEFAELTLVRTAGELGEVRRAAKALEHASQAMVKAVRIGASERDVYGAVQSALGASGVYSPKFILCSGPNRASWEDPPWLFGVGSPRVLEAGDVVLAEIFASCGGLEAQVQMAVAIPPVSPQDMECAKMVRLAYEKGVQNLRPGKKFADVVAAMDAVLDREGFWYLTPPIHSMNPMVCIGRTGVKIDNLPDMEFYRKLGMRFGTGHIRGGDVELEPGMVFELEPNAISGRHRINIGGTVIVTEKGAEPLNEISTRMRLAGEM